MDGIPFYFGRFARVRALLAAKYFGVKVEKFSIGFPPKKLVLKMEKQNIV